MIRKMIKRYFFFAFKNITHRRIRSFLTVTGIFIGIFLIVALISIGQGMQLAINEEFKKTGSNRITITPGGANFGPVSSELSTVELNEKDFEVINGVNGVENSLRILSRTAKVEFRDKARYITVWGVSNDKESLNMIKKIGFFDVSNGREIRTSDRARAVLGDSVAKEIFDEKINVGDSIKINEIEFSVVGIQSKGGTGAYDTLIRIPIDEARKVFDEQDEISMIIVTTYESYDIDDVAENIKRKLRNNRDVKEGEEDFSVETAQQSIETFNNILFSVQLVLIAIAAISLIVGGIGIMNTTYTSVLERTNEIGIMKAVGATNLNIVTIFLFEAGLFGLIGGSLGVILGIFLGKGVEAIVVNLGLPFFKAYVGWPLVIGSILFSFIIGCVSGVIPAIQTTKLNPIDSLRSK